MDNSKEIAVVEEKINGMKSMLETSLVTNDDELQSVSDKIKQVKTLARYIADQKEKLTLPAKAIIAEANARYDPFIKECANAEIVLKQRAGKYMAEKEAERIKEENKIAKAAEAGRLRPETATAKLEALPEAPRTVRTEQSTLQVRKRRVAKIVDVALIPDEYWVVDEVRVRREALARDTAGVEQIPGVQIVEESSVSSL